MLDASIGKLIRLRKGQLSINLTLTNILNNRNICTGGYEQGRSDLTASGNSRGYSFSMNPKKFYAYGINGMLNMTYRFELRYEYEEDNIYYIGLPMLHRHWMQGRRLGQSG